MLKIELGNHIAKQNDELREFLSENKALRRTINELEGELKLSNQESDGCRRQMEQISQSVYTSLQIKYPRDHSFKREENISEQEQFLRFIHGLCVDKSANERAFEGLGY